VFELLEVKNYYGKPWLNYLIHIYPVLQTYLAREKLFVNEEGNYFRFCVSK